MAAFITSSNWRLSINGVDLSPTVSFPISIEAGDVLRPAPPASANEASFTITLGPPRFADSLPIDLAPDFCWRCDATPDVDELGLCGDCRDDLTA